MAAETHYNLTVASTAQPLGSGDVSAHTADGVIRRGGSANV